MDSGTANDSRIVAEHTTFPRRSRGQVAIFQHTWLHKLHAFPRPIADEPKTFMARADGLEGSGHAIAERLCQTPSTVGTLGRLPCALSQRFQNYAHTSIDMLLRHIFGDAHQESLAVAGLLNDLERGLSNCVL